MGQVLAIFIILCLNFSLRGLKLSECTFTRRAVNKKQSGGYIF